VEAGGVVSGRARVAAPAKVNLFLRVLDRREDGFHELETLFQAVSLADEVEVALVEGPEVALELEGPELGPEEDNLAVRAARAFLEASRLETGVRVTLRKEIPAGAGLGGGSSDAAAVLRALDRLTGSPLGPDALRAVGGRLGSDVPFFLGSSPLAAATGRGEALTPLDPLPATELLLVLPPLHVATADAYAALDGSRAGGSPEDGPRLPEAPRSWEEVRGLAWNDFQAVVAGRTPEVARALGALESAGGEPALLSGSGGACFAFLPDATGAAPALARALGWRVLVVRTLERLPAVTLGGEEGP